MLKSRLSGSPRINILGQGQGKRARGVVQRARPGPGSVPGVTGRHHTLLPPPPPPPPRPLWLCNKSHAQFTVLPTWLWGCCTVRCQFFLPQKMKIILHLCDQENYFCSIHPSCLLSGVYGSSSGSPHYARPMRSGWGVSLLCFLPSNYFLEHVTCSRKEGVNEMKT